MDVKSSEHKGTYKSSLLCEGDLPPFEILNEGASDKCILVCDHAEQNVPKKLNHLGLEPEIFETHVAFDCGAKEVTRLLAEKMNVPAILGNYSRLVVDLNRRLDHPTAFLENMEFGPVPGNVSMTDEDRRLRVDEIYYPYHSALEKMIDQRLEKGIVPVIISVHSFIPVFFKQKRPWALCVLWVQDPRVPMPIMDYFRERGFCVGDNEPYDARILRGTTINHHADARRLPNALLELRNDVITTEAAQKEWSDMIAESLSKVLEDPSIHSLYDGPEFIHHDPERERSYFEEVIEKAKKGEV